MKIKCKKCGHEAPDEQWGEGCPACESQIPTVFTEPEQDWYFTFGSGQNPGLGYYAVFHGTYNSAREKMMEAYGKKWAFQYPSAEKAGVERFGLVCINQGGNKIIKGDEL